MDGAVEMSVDRVVAGLVFTEPVPPDRSPLRPLPLAPARIAVPTDGSLRYSFGRLDESGKVPAARLLDLLGWHPGDRLAVGVERQVAIFTRDPVGIVAVARRHALVVPAVTRRACGLNAGDCLLLAAAERFEAIVVHPPAVLDKMMTLYHQGDDRD
jgi:hypothetical protein